jgi:hypothetical protein
LKLKHSVGMPIFATAVAHTAALGLAGSDSA